MITVSYMVLTGKPVSAQTMNNSNLSTGVNNSSSSGVNNTAPSGVNNSTTSTGVNNSAYSDSGSGAGRTALPEGASPAMPGVSDQSYVPAPPAVTEHNPLKEGIAAYNAGNYKKAATALGAALNSDFNNPVLHYYMANSLLHMKQTEAAIREFRIAYALDPHKEVGKYSKEALSILGVEDAPKPMCVVPETNRRMIALPPEPPPRDLLVDQAMRQLRNQADTNSHMQSKLNESIAADEAKRQKDYLAKAQQDLKDSYKVYWGRRGHVRQLPVPTDAQSTLNGLKDLYARQHQSRVEDGRRQVEELQKSARNLEELLNEKPGHHGGTHLVPAGTNLYIRNYQIDPKPPDQSHPTGSSVHWIGY